jgi:uncharacterized protein YuzE
MKVNYDPGVDILTVTFRQSPIEESDEIRPGLIVDYSESGEVVRIELLDASRHMDSPGRVEIQVGVNDSAGAGAALLNV